MLKQPSPVYKQSGSHTATLTLTLLYDTLNFLTPPYTKPIFRNAHINYTPDTSGRPLS